MTDWCPALGFPGRGTCLLCFRTVCIARRTCQIQPKSRPQLHSGSVKRSGSAPTASRCASVSRQFGERVERVNERVSEKRANNDNDQRTIHQRHHSTIRVNSDITGPVYIVWVPSTDKDWINDKCMVGGAVSE